MVSLLPIVISGAAGVALAASLWQIGTRVRALESQRAGSPDASEQSSSGGGARSSKPMLSALYHEPAPSPLSGLASLPGGTWLGAALVLAIVGLSLSGFTPAKAPVTSVVADSSLQRLQGRVDSLGLVVTALRDSVRMVAAGAEPATRVNGSSKVSAKPARQAAGSIPAAPPAPVP